MDSLEIEVEVGEAFIGRVQPKMPVEAILNAYPEWKIPGEVIAIIPTADRGKATVKVRVALKVKDPRIVPEMGVRVSFLEQAQPQAAAKPQGVRVPGGAVVQRDGASVAFVLGDENRAAAHGRGWPGDGQGPPDPQGRERRRIGGGEPAGHPARWRQGATETSAVTAWRPWAPPAAPLDARPRPSRVRFPVPAFRGEPPMSTLVSLRNITKTYQRGPEKVQVLHGIDLDIASGDFVALMGPSGSGKTTLLNLIGGLDNPSGGEISIEGERIDQMSGGQLSTWRSHHVGFVFQFYNLMPMLTAQKNVELPLLLTHLNAAQRRRNAEIALTLVGLADRRSHRPNELSGGQQQRVAIARAIVSDPTFLICDEPTGDLDRQSAEEILGLLQQLNREHGKTIIMVTHDPKAAEYATHTVHLDKGELADAPLAH